MHSPLSSDLSFPLFAFILLAMLSGRRTPQFFFFYSAGRFFPLFPDFAAFSSRRPSRRADGERLLPFAIFRAYSASLLFQ